jgi:multidrug efflux pump subunit AcrB
VYVLRLRYVFILVSIILFAGSIWYAVNHMDFILFPNKAADAFFIYAELPIFSSLTKTAEKMAEIERRIEGLPENEVESYSTLIGTHGERQPGENEHWAYIRVNLTPFAERDRLATEISDDLRAKTGELEGFDKIIYQIEAGGPPVGDPITIRVVGSDDDIRRALTDSLVAYLSGMEGVKDLDRNDKLGKEQIRINVDYAEVARLGLTVAGVAQTVRLAYDGEIVTNVRYGDEDVDFRVILKEGARLGKDYLPGLLIPNNQGRLIPLKKVAMCTTEPGPSSYYHFDRERTTTVTGDVVPEITTPVEATNAVIKHFDLSKDWPGMRFVIGGEAEETQESFRSLYIAFGVAVIAIFFLLILLFNSVTQPIAVLVAIPFGIISVIIGFAIHGEPIGFLALMGLVGLSGVVVNDSLVMVNRINQLRKLNPDLPIVEVVSQGTADRLRAVTMTTLTTVAGLLPLAYGIGGSDPFIAPMALALGYGLVFATPLTLALVPSLYMVRTDVFRVINRIFRTKLEY